MCVQCVFAIKYLLVETGTLIFILLSFNPYPRVFLPLIFTLERVGGKEGGREGGREIDIYGENTSM